MTLLWLWACAPTPVTLSEVEWPPAEEVPPVDSATEVEQVPGSSDVDLAEAVFNLDAVHQIELTLPEASIASLWADPYTHVEATLTFDGETLPHPVGARNKGRYGSYRDLDHKSGFKLDLNFSGVDQRIFGLKHLNINNMVQDYSQVHDLAAYAAYHAAGTHAPRVGYAWLRVNGEDYGLYLLVEDYDDTFLDARYEDPSGNLYDGDYWLAEDWSYYILLDFTPDKDDYFKLEEGEEVGLQDIMGVTAAVGRACASGDFYDRMDEVIDMDQFLRVWTVEMWVGQYDGYAYNTNNYRVYFDPTDGRARFLPWDHDWAFYDTTPITTPLGRLAACCMADEVCWARAVEVLAETCAAIDATPIADEVRTAQDLIRPYLEADPRKEQSLVTYASGQRHLRGWLEGRSAALAEVFGF